MIKELVAQLEENPRGALSDLRAEIKQEEKKEELKHLIGDGAKITAFLYHQDAKVRKNAALLLGDLEMEEVSGELFAAYEREDKRFIRASLLQSLEKTGAYMFLPQLKEQYETLCAYVPQENEKKHISEELQALEHILRKEGKSVSHTFCGWKEKLTVLLTTNPLYAEITADKINAARKGVNSLGVKAVVDNLREVINVRTFRELLFPIALKQKVTVSDSPELLGEALASSGILTLLERCHREEAPFYFRLELRLGQTLEERSRYTKRAARVLEEKSNRKLLNSAEEYEFEVRILADKTGKLYAFLKMNTIPAERFSYRKRTVAASIYPSDAALLAELAKPYLKENAQILDPCCGVGTMLIERHKLLPAREIYGIDIFGEAIEGARENCKRAGVRANFIHRDYFDFKHEYLFDEIIANMPLRGKKTKEEQDTFYAKFFEKSKELLVKDGILILYSNETGFIKKQLRLHQEFKLQQEFAIRKKDEFSLYIISLREK